MSNSKKKRRERECTKQLEKLARHKQRVRKYGIVFAILYVVSVLPYANDLFVHPNVWNGLIVVTLTIGGLIGIGWIVRNEIKK